MWCQVAPTGFPVRIDACSQSYTCLSQHLDIVVVRPAVYGTDVVVFFFRRLLQTFEENQSPKANQDTSLSFRDLFQPALVSLYFVILTNWNRA